MSSSRGTSNDSSRAPVQQTRSKLRRLIAICSALACSLAAPVPAFADTQVSEPPATAGVEPDSSPARFDANLGLKGWNIPFPSFGDTLTQDVGGFRTALASAGIGFLDFTIPIMALNLLDPGETAGPQEYWGQELSGFVGSQAFVMVDMGHYGVPGGQLQISGQGTLSSWEPFFPNTLSLNRLAYYQSLFENRVEFLFGYTTLDTAFVGTFVGGNIASPFGPVALIPFELGMAGPPAVAPAAWLKLNILPTVYNQFGIQRSLPPAPNPFIANADLNPTGFAFTLDDARVLLIDEVGYKRPPAPDKPYLWARLGAMYNTSPYTDFSEPGETSPNFGAYLLADGEVMQFDPSSPQTAYRGLYLGGSAMYALPETNFVSQYYEARAYVQGPFRSRPRDQIGLVYFHQVFSHYLRDATNAASSTTGLFARSASNTITASYTGNILPGLYATSAISYTDHPSFIFVGDGEHALLFLASLFIAL